VALVAYWATAFIARPAAAQDTYAIVINVPEHRLYLYQGSVLISTYPVAVGKPHTPTPRGEFTITQKAIWGDGFGTRWMRFSVPWGIYGIHGTNKPWSVGTVASHGCIRMFNRNVEELYAKVSIGTPVTVVGPTPYVKLRRSLSLGAIGQDVVELQRLLRLAHTYSGRLDGIYSPLVEQAVKDFQRQQNLSETGRADKLLIKLLQEKTGQANLLPGYLGNRGALSLRHTT
jgi:hypothetical protein